MIKALLQNPSFKRSLVPAGVFLAMFLSCFLLYSHTGLFEGGFNVFINGHLVTEISSDVGESGFAATVSKYLKQDRNSGRFQPLWYLNEIVLTQIIGTEASAWFFWACSLASLTMFLLFMFGVFSGMPPSVSLLFSCFVLIGQQVVMWAQPNYPQVIGTFLLAASLFLSVAGLKTKRAKFKIAIDVGCILATIAASLSKESYIICIPALVAVRIWVFQNLNKVTFYKALLENLKFAASLLIIATLELLYIFAVIGTKGMGYAGIQEETFQIARVINTALGFIAASNLMVFVIVFVSTVLVTIGKKMPVGRYFRELFWPFLISCMFSVPQIVLYTKTGISGYYLIPATFGSAYLIACSLPLVASRSKMVFYMSVIAAFVLILIQLPVVIRTFNRIALDNANINSILSEAAACAPDGEFILVVANPRVRLEAAQATHTILSKVHKKSDLVVATYGLEKTDFFSRTLEGAERYWSFINPESIARKYGGRTFSTFERKSDISAIIVFDGLDGDFFNTSRDWFRPEHFTVEMFPIALAPANLYCRIRSTSN